MTGAGLKKCIPTTRSGRGAAAAIAVTSSEEVLLASTHSSADDLLGEPRVQLVLERESLGGGLDHELAWRERGEVVRGLDPRGGRVGLLGAQPPLGGFLAEPVARVSGSALQRLGHGVVEDRARA